MNDEYIGMVKVFYGEDTAVEMDRDADLGRSKVARLAKAVSFRRKIVHPTSEPFTSVPVPMDFDPEGRREP